MRRLAMNLIFVVSTTLFIGNLSSSSGSSVIAAPAVVPGAIVPVGGDSSTNNDGNSNIAFQLVGYVKDSVVRMVDGTKELWSNHGRCNQIRGKQKDYRERLQKQWEFEEQGWTPKEMKQRLAKINGGISYDEFVFLMKGKEDRGKLMNLVFLGWGAPRLFPYAMMFYPNMLPGPFAPLHDASGRESKLGKLSRERSHAVIRTLLAIENEAKAVPVLAKLNIFGKKKQARQMDEMDSLGKTIRQIMTAPETEISKHNVASIAMNTIDEALFRPLAMTRAEQRLCFVPKCVINGILTTIEGPNLLQGIMPSFMKRGQILNHIQKLNDVDHFLVNEKINLDDLSTARLLEACSDRMIVGPGQTDEERRKHLQTWLDLSVNEPTERIEKTGEYFNTNLAKTILIGYYSLNGARDDRSASYLPREMFSAKTQIE